MLNVKAPVKTNTASRTAGTMANSRRSNLHTHLNHETVRQRRSSQQNDSNIKQLRELNLSNKVQKNICEQSRQRKNLNSQVKHALTQISQMKSSDQQRNSTNEHRRRSNKNQENQPIASDRSCELKSSNRRKTPRGQGSVVSEEPCRSQQLTHTLTLPSKTVSQHPKEITKNITDFHQQSKPEHQRVSLISEKKDAKHNDKSKLLLPVNLNVELDNVPRPETDDESRTMLLEATAYLSQLQHISIETDRRTNKLNKELEEMRLQIEESILQPLDEKQRAAAVQAMEELMSMQQELCEQKIMMKFMNDYIYDYMKRQKILNDEERDYLSKRQQLDEEYERHKAQLNMERNSLKEYNRMNEELENICKRHQEEQEKTTIEKNEVDDKFKSDENQRNSQAHLQELECEIIQNNDHNGSVKDKTVPEVVDKPKLEEIGKCEIDEINETMPLDEQGLDYTTSPMSRAPADPNSWNNFEPNLMKKIIFAKEKRRPWQIEDSFDCPTIEYAEMTRQETLTPDWSDTLTEEITLVNSKQDNDERLVKDPALARPECEVIEESRDVDTTRQRKDSPIVRDVTSTVAARLAESRLTTGRTKLTKGTPKLRQTVALHPHHDAPVSQNVNVAKQRKDSPVVRDVTGTVSTQPTEPRLTIGQTKSTKGRSMVKEIVGLHHKHDASGSRDINALKQRNDSPTVRVSTRTVRPATPGLVAGGTKTTKGRSMVKNTAALPSPHVTSESQDAVAPKHHKDLPNGKHITGAVTLRHTESGLAAMWTKLSKDTPKAKKTAVTHPQHDALKSRDTNASKQRQSSSNTKHATGSVNSRHTEPGPTASWIKPNKDTTMMRKTDVIRPQRDGDAPKQRKDSPRTRKIAAMVKQKEIPSLREMAPGAIKQRKDTPIVRENPPKVPCNEIYIKNRRSRERRLEFAKQFEYAYQNLDRSEVIEESARAVLQRHLETISKYKLEGSQSIGEVQHRSSDRQR